MSSSLPDLSGLSSVRDATWRQLGERLHEVGLNARYLRDTLPSGLRVYERLQAATRLWRAWRRHDAAAYAYRAFILRDPVPDTEAAEVLGPRLLDELVGAGLLARPEPGRVVSRFDCRFFMGMPILCDDLAHQGEAVFGAGPGTDAFTGRFCQASRQRGSAWPAGQRRVGSWPTDCRPGSWEWSASAAARPLSPSGRTAPPRAIAGSAAAIAGSSSTSAVPAC